MVKAQGEIKFCPQCETALPLTAFCKDKRRVDGLTVYCKKCRNGRERERYAESEEIRKWVRERGKVWHEAHREQHNAQIRAWHREKRNDPEYREVARQREHEYDNSDRGREVRAQYRQEFGNARRRERYRDDPEFRDRIDSYNRWCNHARRAPGSFTVEQWEVLCELAEGKCLACGKRGKLTVDHVVPVIKGGTNEITNIQPLCDTCNKRKGSKTLDHRSQQLAEWAGRRI